MPHSAYIRRRALENSFELYGHLFSLLATERDTAGQFTLVEVTPTPGLELPPHVRSLDDEAFYVLAGEMENRIGDEYLMAGPGDFVMVPPGRERSFRFTTPHPRLLLLLAPAVAEESLRRLGHPARFLPGPGRAECFGLGPQREACCPDAEVGSAAGCTAVAVAAPSLTRRRGPGRSFWSMGHLLTFLATGEDTHGRFTLIEAEASPGQEPPRHVHHREDETYYVLEGEAAFDVGGERFLASPGNVVFLPRGVPHSFEIRSGRARVLILVTPSGLEGYFKAFAEPAKALTLPPPPERPYDPARIAAVAGHYGIELVAPAG